MTNETEAMQADVAVKFELPNGKHLLGKPVPFPVARRIMALLYTFDSTGDYEGTLSRALDEFVSVSGITEDAVMALCPTMTLGELTTAVQAFFFQRRPTPNGARSAPVEATPQSGA